MNRDTTKHKRTLHNLRSHLWHRASVPTPLASSRSHLARSCVLLTWVREAHDLARNTGGPRAGVPHLRSCRRLTVRYALGHTCAGQRWEVLCGMGVFSLVFIVLFYSVYVRREG